MARTQGTATAGAQPSVEARGQSEEQVVAARNGAETRGEVGGVRESGRGSGHVGLWQGCSEAGGRQVGTSPAQASTNRRWRLREMKHGTAFEAGRLICPTRRFAKVTVGMMLVVGSGWHEPTLAFKDNEARHSN